MSQESEQSAQAPLPAKKRTSRTRLIILGFALLILILLTQVGFYTVQPVGAIPDGVTLLVRRSAGEPFFNSPDALCLEIQGGVSLLCRAMAIGEAPIDRVLVRLPYMAWAYLASTGGRSFER